MNDFYLYLYGDGDALWAQSADEQTVPDVSKEWLAWVEATQVNISWAKNRSACLRVQAQDMSEANDKASEILSRWGVVLQGNDTNRIFRYRFLTTEERIETLLKPAGQKGQD